MIVRGKQQTGLLERRNRQDFWREGTDRIVGEREQTELLERGKRQNC
jgi:hypothetical protein